MEWIPDDAGQWALVVALVTLVVATYGVHLQRDASRRSFRVTFHQCQVADSARPGHQTQGLEFRAKNTGNRRETLTRGGFLVGGENAGFHWTAGGLDPGDTARAALSYEDVAGLLQRKRMGWRTRFVVDTDERRWKHSVPGDVRRRYNEYLRGG